MAVGLRAGRPRLGLPPDDAARGDGLPAGPHLFRLGPPRQGRLQRPFLRGDRARRGFEHRRRLARAHRLRPAVGRRATDARDGRRGREPVPRRRVVLQRHAGLRLRAQPALEKRLRPARRRQQRNVHGRGLVGLARRVRTHGARAVAHARARPRLRRRRRQGSPRKLQSALRIAVDQRRHHPRRGGADGRRQNPRLDARPHGVRSARPRQSLHSRVAAQSLFQ